MRAMVASLKRKAGGGSAQQPASQPTESKQLKPKLKKRKLKPV